jgi:hypothetical protein
MNKILSASLLGLASTVLNANIFITEIMYNPSGTDIPSPTFSQEWVEIYNAGTTTVDLTGWTFRDEDDGAADWGVMSGSLAPGQVGVITTSTEEAFKASWPSAVNAAILTTSTTNPNWGSLGNNHGIGDEVLTLRDASDNIIDIVDYTSGSALTGGWPDAPSGASIYLLPGFMTSADNDIGSHWGYSVLGINGAINPISSVLDPYNVGSVGSPGVVVVPESSVYALLFGLGVLGLAIFRRRH